MLAFDWVNPKWKSVSGGPAFPLRFFSGHLGGPEANVVPTGKGLAICNPLSLPKKKAKLLITLTILGCTKKCFAKRPPFFTVSAHKYLSKFGCQLL